MNQQTCNVIKAEKGVPMKAAPSQRYFKVACRIRIGSRGAQVKRTFSLDALRRASPLRDRSSPAIDFQVAGTFVTKRS